MRLDRCEDYTAAASLAYAVGLGKIVLPTAAWHNRARRPWLHDPRALHYVARNTVTRTKFITGAHLQRHPNMCSALRGCCEGPQSRWSVMTMQEAKAADAQKRNEIIVTLDNLEDIRRFFLTERRIALRPSADGRVTEPSGCRLSLQ